METFQHKDRLQQALQRCRSRGDSVVLVPTMGNLHDGHLSLIRTARDHGQTVIASIFVNPMQFGKNEDLAAYPRTLAADQAGLEAAGCDLLFTPEVAEIYPQGLAAQTVVSVPGISTRHCGASRPGHFDGVATVVSKLFNIVRPDKAIFGLKDYQQFQVIRKLVHDLCYPIEIIGVETRREDSGLAMSSRNGYLDAGQKQIAPVLYQQLQQAADRLIQGNDTASVEIEAAAALQAAGMQPDYFTVCQAQTLEPADEKDSDLVILAAAWLGTTRLIDNIRLIRNTR